MAIDTGMPSGPILLVVDGSESAGKAARRAAVMASSLKTKLYAVAVVDTETLEHLHRANILVREEMKEFEIGLAESAKHHLRLVATIAREAGAEYEEVLARGGWHQTVLARQREIGARVIVLSGFTSTMVHHDSLERAKQRIIEEAPCSVVVVR
jgi:nucleotide-binding universal stress UspA family protein